MRRAASRGARETGRPLRRQHDQWIAADLRARRERGRLAPHYRHAERDKGPLVDAIRAAGAWVRDLTEEGIEPNPGPRYISKNVNGMSGLANAVKMFMRIVKSHQQKPITAIFIQEHNIKESGVAAMVAAARDCELIIAIAPCPDGTPKGGTAIIIPRSAVEIAPRSNFSSTLEKLESSVRTLPSGRAVTLRMSVEGTPTQLTSAYAPARSASRPNFFSIALRQFITKDTILGIDANCVPNEALDLQRASTSPYDNAGSTELASLMAEAELVDVARECLGDEPFFTSHHNVQGNTTTRTRIDQLYAPDRDGLTWSHVPVQEELSPDPETRCS